MPLLVIDRDARTAVFFPRSATRLISAAPCSQVVRPSLYTWRGITSSDHGRYLRCHLSDSTYPLNTLHNPSGAVMSLDDLQRANGFSVGSETYCWFQTRPTQMSTTQMPLIRCSSAARTVCWPCTVSRSA